VKENRFETLLELSNAVRNAVSTMKSLKCTGHLNNPTILKNIALKLPGMLQLSWGEERAKGEDLNLEMLADWLSKKAKAASYMSCFQASAGKPPDLARQFERRDGGRTSRVYTASEDEWNSDSRSGDHRTCIFCKKENPPLYKCKEFLKLGVPERWTWVREKQVCYSCLAKGHRS